MTPGRAELARGYFLRPSGPVLQPVQEQDQNQSPAFGPLLAWYEFRDSLNFSPRPVCIHPSGRRAFFSKLQGIPRTCAVLPSIKVRALSPVYSAHSCREASH